MVTPNSLTNYFLSLHILKFKRSNISSTEYKPTKNSLGLYISPWAGSRNFTLRYFIYLILAQIHSHIFNLAHRIRRKIYGLKKEETLFETSMKLCNMRFEEIKI